MNMLRTVALGLLVLAVGISAADSAFAARETIDSSHFAAASPPGSSQIRIAKTVIKSTKGPSSQHPVHQCPPKSRWDGSRCLPDHFCGHHCS